MRRVLAVVVVAVVSSLVFAAGALGAVVGLELRTVAGLLDSAAAKSATASCPAGKQVTGAAAFKTHGAFGEVRLVAARPAADLKSVVSTFREDETGFAGDWQPTAHALCVSPLTGMQRVTATSASTSAAKTVTATCPSGKRLIGLGAETTGGNQVVLDVIRPNPGLTAAVVTAREDQTGFAGNWTVSAYAVCAVAPQGLQRVSAAGQVTPAGPDIVANCPAGKGLLGVGGEASGGSGQVAIETYATPAGEPTGGVARGFEDQDGYAPAWTLTSYAICANAAALAVGQSATNSNQFRHGDVLCPSGKSFTGGGSDLTGSFGQAHLIRLAPTSDLGLFNAESAEDVNGFAGNWSQRGYAVCGTPLAGLEMVSVTAGTVGVGARASCPTGKKVVGAGGEVFSNAFAADILLEDIAPLSELTAVDVLARVAEGGTGAGGSTTAHAICANPPPGLQLVSARDPDADSEEVKDVSATCPAGKHLLGAGGAIDSGLNQVVLDDLRLDNALKKVTVTGFEDETGYDGTWFPRAYAICANY